MISCRTLGQRGMTLVELLVAMVISMVLLAGIYQVFTGSINSNRENEQFSRLQENARFAMVVFGRDVRMAGYTGCAQIPPAQVINTLNTPGGFLNNLAVGLEGFDWAGAIDGNAVLIGDYLPIFNADSNLPMANIAEGSDILTVRSAAGNPIYLENIMGATFAAGTAASILTSAALDIPDGDAGLINQGDILMLADCTRATVFQVSAVAGAGNANVAHSTAAVVVPGNSTQDLQYRFPAGSELMQISTISYLIANNPAGVPSLFRTDRDSSEELVQGVERMQIRYGVDNDGDRQVDTYLTAAGASADWSQVIAVRISLLLMSQINGRLPQDNATYDLDGDGAADYGPINDRRMRRVFKATFALRNRVS